MTEAEPAEMGLAETGLAPSKSARRRKAAARKGLGGGQKGKAGPALKEAGPARRRGREGPRLNWG